MGIVNQLRESVSAPAPNSSGQHRLDRGKARTNKPAPSTDVAIMNATTIGAVTG